MLSTLQVLRSTPRFYDIACRSLTTKAVSTTETASVTELPKAAEVVDEISEVFEVPKRVTPTHNIPVCNLQFRGYIPQKLDFYADFARRAAYHLGMPCSGTIPLPTQRSRWTVIRSPFVHKKSQENFERRTHKRLIQIKDADPEVVDRWLKYLTMNAPSGIGMRASRIHYESIEKK
ncbi:ribosomal protein S10 domain-containing protein [Pilobolus umbonatus]|nr:ribosomal protein S10 domain-containing protein [Pilobolus umbonatus]